MCCILQHFDLVVCASDLAQVLPCTEVEVEMRSAVLVKMSLAICGVTALAAATAQVANLSISLPFEQLELAFNLTRVLIQL